MKKLFLILVLGFMFYNQAYANPPLERYVFEKLYDEYSHCTVYYKFLSRGVERKKDVTSLTEKEKLFVKEMNNLSEEAEKNMYFFSSKINVSNENIQLNIQEIYKAYLDIAGSDYSKPELLNDKYYALCSNSLEDPKSRMFFWEKKYQVNKEMPSSSEKPKEFKGVNLHCSDKLKILTDEYATIYFVSSRKAEFYKIENFEVVKEILNYKQQIDKIIFLKNFKEYFVLSRENLQFGSMTCQIVTIPAENLANFVLKKIIEKQKKQNKI